MNRESLDDRIVPSATHLYAVGEDIGGSSVVRVYNEDGNPELTIAPFGAGFTGGVHVATGDVTGDGTDDIVVAAGPGGGPEVKVFDGATMALVRDFFAYDPGFMGGVNVAVGDVTGDGHADIITGTGTGGGPNVRVYDGATGGLDVSFFAYESWFRGGVNVAAGDVNGDGHADIVTGTGIGGGPRVQVFDGATGAEVQDFFAYDPSVRSGVSVAAGDLQGNGLADIVTGVGPGGGPNVRVYDGATGGLDDSFFAYDPGFLGGVSVEVVTQAGTNDILVAPGPSSGGYVELLDRKSLAGVGLFQPFPNFQGGITTGQGVATLGSPFSTAFASPVVSLGSGGGGGGGTVADNGGGSYYYDPNNWYVYPYNYGSTPYTPDPGSTYTPDPGSSYSSDPGTSYSDPGSYDSGDDGSDCGCGDSDPGDSGGYTDPGDSGSSGDDGSEDW
ncbi:MAG TPA: FG-GAP-like repeat-containing protein [Urbifossiella sp.]|nr:FG-GAP-like repeat-containing protein [Urbifossiella sp.]